MNRPALICFRCGHEGSDVAVKVVDLEEEAKRDGQRVRTVEVELVNQLRHVREVTRVTVPERFATEYRCRDVAGCEQRYQAQQADDEPMPSPEGQKAHAVTEEENTPWL